jgi:hypothetical protein
MTDDGEKHDGFLSGSVIGKGEEFKNPRIQEAYYSVVKER